jgi:hypothetical protein
VLPYTLFHPDFQSTTPMNPLDDNGIAFVLPCCVELPMNRHVLLTLQGNRLRELSPGITVISSGKSLVELLNNPMSTELVRKCKILDFTFLGVEGIEDNVITNFLNGLKGGQTTQL